VALEIRVRAATPETPAEAAPAVWEAPLGGINLSAAVSFLLLYNPAGLAGLLLFVPVHPETPETPAMLVVQHLPLASILREETVALAVVLAATAELRALPALPAIRDTMLLVRLHSCPPGAVVLAVEADQTRAIREATTVQIHSALLVLVVTGVVVLAPPAATPAAALLAMAPGIRVAALFAGPAVAAAAVLGRVSSALHQPVVLVVVAEVAVVREPSETPAQVVETPVTPELRGRSLA